MPSPVIGLTREAASPTSSTGPSGWSQRRPESGRWWPSQRTSGVVAVPGRSSSSCSSSIARESGAAPTQLAVPDVGQAVAAVERPGVRRLAPLAVPDHLAAAPGRRGGDVPADRQRAPGARGEAQRGPDAGVRAVGPDQHAGGGAVVEHHPARGDGEPADPPAAQHGAGGDGPRDQPGVEDRARHHPGGPRHRAGHGVPVAGVAAADLEAAQRGPAVDHVAGADLAEHVDGVRGDPVAAGLVAGEVGTVEQQHPQRRVGAQRAEGGGRPGGAGADDHEVPVGTRAGGGRHRAHTSTTTSTTAIPTAARNGASPRPTRASPASAATEQRGRPRRHRRESGAKTRSTTVASTSAATASSRVRVAPSRCGSPRTPVAASSARSGSTLTRCAPTPSSAPPATTHGGVAGRAVGRREVDEDGQQAEGDGVGQPGPGGGLGPRL